MSGRRVARIVYVVCGVAGLLVALGIGALMVKFPSVSFGEAFVGGFTWRFSAEHAALKGAGCIQAIRVPRVRESAMRAGGASDEYIARYCDADGRCGYEAVHCTAIEKNVVPCDIVASLHKRYGKPDHRYSVKTITVPKMAVTCEAVYDADGKFLVDLLDARKRKKARADD